MYNALLPVLTVSTHLVCVPAVIEQHCIARVRRPLLCGHVPQEHLGANSSDDGVGLQPAARGGGNHIPSQ
jgi:hypothetical protein